jgi:hypothetical protein
LKASVGGDRCCQRVFEGHKTACRLRQRCSGNDLPGVAGPQASVGGVEAAFAGERQEAVFTLESDPRRRIVAVGPGSDDGLSAGKGGSGGPFDCCATAGGVAIAGEHGWERMDGEDVVELVVGESDP